MAFNAGTGWEVRTSAADANGGGGFSGGGSNLAAPSAPTTGTATTGGTVAANTYYAVICYLDVAGNPGPKSAQTTQVTTGATSTLTVTSPAASAGAVSYAVWWTVTNGGPYWPSPGTAVAIGTNSTRTTTPATSGTQPPGTDYSQQDGAQIAYTDAVVQSSTTTAVSILNPFTPAIVGNVFNVTSGGTVQRAQVTAVSATAVATFDKSLGTAAQVCVGNLGGALSTLSAAALLTVAGNSVYVKSGTYAETLTISVSGGSGTPILWIGYSSTRGDTPTGTGRPLIDAATSRSSCVTSGATSGNVVRNFRGAGSTAANFVITSGVAVYINCKASGAATSGWLGGSGFLIVVGCEASANGGAGIDNGASANGSAFLYGVYAHDNITNGILSISTAATFMVQNSIVEANGASGISLRTGRVLMTTVDGNTGATSDGIVLTSTSSGPEIFFGNILTNNGRYGINRGATSAMALSDYSDLYGNITSAYNNVAVGPGDVASDPQFVDAQNGNFAIGTNLKALGWPGVFPGGLSTGYLDPGAVQRQEAGGSGGAVLVGPGNLVGV